MSRLALAFAHALVLLCLPILFVGVVQRTRARWAGRKGPRLGQTFSDLARLLRKRPVYSKVTTPLFTASPLVVLATTLVSGLLVPLVAPSAPISFPCDFVALAYLWGLGRIFLVLSALDTGSAFEGMGASREATFAALTEPTLFLVLGSLALATGHTTFASLLHPPHAGGLALLPLACAIALLMVLQVEGARGPVDDPATHLELTMVHEVMILDHSGPELAALQYAAAMKMTLCASLVAALANPLSPSVAPLAYAAAHVGLVLAVAIVVGLVESLVARLPLRAVPQYLLVSFLTAFFALLVSAFAATGAA